MTSHRNNLTGVLDQMDNDAEGEKLTFGEIVDSFGDRGYGPILLALALIELLPTGAVPGVPTMVAVAVILVAGQLVAGRSAPWIPKKMRSKGFTRQKFEKAREKIRPFTQKLDKVIKGRMHQFATPFAARLVGGACILVALPMPPLELLPFASSVPALAIGLFGIGLSARDGLIILIASILAVFAIVGGVYGLAF